MAESYYREPGVPLVPRLGARPSLAGLADASELPPIPDDPTGGDVFGTLFSGSTRRTPELPSLPAIEGLAAAAQRDQPSIRSGFKINDDDIAQIRSEVPDFLAQGNADREAREADDAAMGARSIFQGGRTEEDRQRSALAFEGLQQARRRLDPAYDRRQKSLGALEGADTFIDPRMVAAREANMGEEVEQQGRLKELGLAFGVDPRAQQLGEQEFGRKKELEGIKAAGQAGTYQPEATAAPGAALAAGGGKVVPRDRVQRFAQQRGISYAEAVAMAKAEGWTVAE